jgi:hypothetical protein
MRSCAGCQVDVPDDSETCPRCGAIVPRGLVLSGVKLADVPVGSTIEGG